MQDEQGGIQNIVGWGGYKNAVNIRPFWAQRFRVDREDEVNFYYGIGSACGCETGTGFICFPEKYTESVEWEQQPYNDHKGDCEFGTNPVCLPCWQE